MFENHKTETLSQIAVSVFRLNGELIEWGNHLARPLGITSARWQVLGAIDMCPRSSPPNIPQIGATMGITRQGVLKQINLLVQEGLVEALPNPHHKRSPLYRLTEEGSRILQQLHTQWEAHLASILSDLGTEDLETTQRVLTTLSQHHTGGAQPDPES